MKALKGKKGGGTINDLQFLFLAGSLQLKPSNFPWRIFGKFNILLSCIGLLCRGRGTREGGVRKADVGPNIKKGKMK